MLTHEMADGADRRRHIDPHHLPGQPFNRMVSWSTVTKFWRDGAASRFARLAWHRP